ncbi:MAG TPA: TonB-dependent receptor [Gemmatimonadales bacterium]|nr:TonB-dependent receptor [Gemmatimonadales bacterium]
MVPRISPVALWAALVLFASTGRLAAQGGVIRGHVADTAGAPLARASVSVDAIGLRATTNDQGDYEIKGVAAGTYSVRARLLGYGVQVVRVSVSEAGPARQDFVLRPQPIGLAPVDVVVGSRARHTAADELAVPVDVFSREQIQVQGTTETSQILQQLTPSVNFPHQSVTDAGDIVRPFTLRGLSPDQTLVLVNGWRQHQTALVNNFTYGMGAGSSGVDLNTIPQSAIDRIEVLRDGASAQYGSDAIAGVVNIVMREGEFTPFLAVDAGRFIPNNFADDGTTTDVNGGWGVKLGRGSLALFGEFLDRQPTNRAYADAFDNSGPGVVDSVNSQGQVVIKRNPVPQPNHHWGDGLEKDAMTLANFRLPLNDAGSSEVYAFGGYSFRKGTGNAYRRCGSVRSVDTLQANCASFITDRDWPEIYPLGYLPQFSPNVTDYSAAGGWRGTMGGWSLDLGASFGHNDFDYDLTNTLNVSLGPCLDPAAPCSPTGLANKTSFFAGRLMREELITQANVTKSLRLGLPAPVNLAFGAAFRRERYVIRAGETASWIDGKHVAPMGDSAVSGSQGFPGFSPLDARDNNRSNVGAYADAETELSAKVLADVAGRFEHYSDFGSRVTGKLALRYQPAKQLTLRGAASTGFRAPGISQEYFRHLVTNVIGGRPLQVIIAPVNDTIARLLGSKPLRDETSVNLSGGFAYSPSSDVTLTTDYFYIKINHRIMLSATFDSAATLAYLASHGEPGFGGAQYFTNGLDTRTQGVDVTANWRIPALGPGALDLTAGVNWTKNEITHVDPLPPILQATKESGLIDTVTWIGITEERPDWRGTLTGQYSVSRFHTLARASYYGKFSSAQPGFCGLCRERYGAKTLVDAEVGYRFNEVDLSVGVRNLFDVFPDQPKSQVIVDTFGDTSQQFNNNFGTFPWAAASPFGYNGRYIYTRASITLSR